MDLQPSFLAALDSDPEEAWRAFVTEYSGVVLATVGRFLPDPDLRMDAYLAVLETIRGDGFRRLRRYVERDRQETVPFAAWLKLVARNVALDVLRRYSGRRTEPEVIARRDPIDRALFRSLYWDRMTYAEAFEVVRARVDPHARFEEIASRADAIHCALSRAGFRLACRRAPGAARAISFDDDASPQGLEAEATAAAAAAGLSVPRSPDEVLEGAHREDAMAGFLADLSEGDRVLVTLRYGEGLRAAEIAPLIGAGSAKAVYRRLDRLIERLRRKAATDPGLRALPEARPEEAARVRRRRPGE